MTLGLTDTFCSECEVAIAALNGRWFGGRTIDASQYEEQRFLRDDLSG